MRQCRILFITLYLLVSIPINIFALDINISGDGSGYSNTGGGGGGGGGEAASIGFGVGFRAALYHYDNSSSNGQEPSATMENYRYYIRKRWMTNTSMEAHQLMYGTGIYAGHCERYGSAGISRFIGSPTNICNGTFTSSFSCEYVNDSSSRFVGFLEPTAQHAGPTTAGMQYCQVYEQDNGLMTNTSSFEHCVFSTKPGVNDQGINFQAGNLVNYLQHSDINDENSFISLMIKYLYNKTSMTQITSGDVENDYILIEPLYYYQYGGLEYVGTVKDIYIRGISGGSYNKDSTGRYKAGTPRWLVDAIGTIYAGSDGKMVNGYGNGSTFAFGKAACWHEGIGAIYIDMTEGWKSCTPDQCCFDKVSDNTYKYDSTNATSGDYHQWNKYKLKNPNNSTFVTTVNSQKQIKDTYLDNHQFSEPDSTFEKCGCDQTDPDMCCYAYDGITYTYKPELNASTTDKYNYYQFIDAATGKPAPNDTRPGEFKSCGCDPETQCCYDSTGTYQASYQDTGYGVAGRYSMNNGKLTPCFCASSSSSNGSCGGKATKKQVNAGDNQLACLANFDSSGKSRSNVPGAYYNNEVGCEFEYEVSYPEPSPKPTAESGKKLQLVTGPLVTVKVTRKCVSTNKSKLEALTAKPTITFSSKKFKYDDQSMLGLTSDKTFDLYTRDDKTESGKSFKYQSENVATTINEGDYFLRVYTYTYNYYIPYLEYDSTEGVAKILSTERPEENNDFWINKLPIPYNAKSKTGKDYTRYISMNIKQNGSNNLSYSDGGITCNYNVTDTNKVKFFYRVIDLDNMNKLGRTLGYNWSDTRGQTVKTAVEKTGNYANLTNGNNGIFSFTLDPATMVMIRNYNKKESQGNHGGYNDGDRLTETKEGVNGCHYHWYSPFLYCLYYGNDGTNCDISTSVDVSGCSVKFKNNDNLKNTFDNYTSISKPNGGGFDQYDFETNMGNLIKKQHNLG